MRYPLLVSFSFSMADRINSNTVSVVTNWPAFMAASRAFPFSDPDATSALRRSPEDRWVKLNSATIFSHWVPLPDPGPPATQQCLSIKTFEELIETWFTDRQWRRRAGWIPWASILNTWSNQHTCRLVVLAFEDEIMLLICSTLPLAASRLALSQSHLKVEQLHFLLIIFSSTAAFLPRPCNYLCNKVAIYNKKSSSFFFFLTFNFHIASFRITSDNKNVLYLSVRTLFVCFLDSNMLHFYKCLACLI